MGAIMSLTMNVLLERSDIWQTSLFFCDYPSFAEQQASMLEAIAQSVAKQKSAIESDVAIGAKRSLYESDFQFLQQNPQQFAALQSFFEQAVAMACWELNHPYWPEDAEPKVSICESWYHVSENGSYHDIHQHPNCSWCGIFYLDAGVTALSEQNGVNRFYEPRPALQYLDAGNAYLNAESYWDIAPKAGQLVVFPAYLRHSAMTYFGQSPRVVLAFNCQVHF